MNTIKSLFQHLWALLTGLGQAELNYIETTTVPLLKTSVGTILMTLAPIALQAVISAEVPGVAGKDKFANALTTLKTAAVSAGIAAGTQLLNKSIEDSVALMQATITATQPATVAATK
jgi:hypothetical protein